MRIPLASTGLRSKDIQLAIQVLESGNLTMGPMVKEFESRVAEYLKVKHFVMVNSGSSANLLMLEALLRPSKGNPKLLPGDGVLVPAIAWPTTIWPILQLGLIPIFVDIDPNTLAIDLEKAQAEILKSDVSVRAIFPIHPLGYALSPKALTAFAARNELVLINDVCESLGSWREGLHAGTCGIAGSFSFYFSHHITTMEGGGVATNDDAFADDLRSMRSHGWSRDRSDSSEWLEDVSENDSKFLFVSTGFNIRPMEIQAAIGISQIGDVDQFISRRRNIATRVLEAVEGGNLSVIGKETLQEDSLQETNSWMLIPIQITGSNVRERKERILEVLKKNEIETRPVLTGNFLTQPALKNLSQIAAVPEDFSAATEIANSTFLIGAHHDLSDSQIEFLANSLNTICDL